MISIAKKVAHSIKARAHRATTEDALRDIAEVLLKQGHVCEALNLLGPQDLDLFVSFITNLISAPHAYDKKILAKALQSVVRIVGWVRKDWANTHRLLHN